jgi:hypothetical protein
MSEGLVNLLPILKDLAHTSPNVELLENKKKIKYKLYSDRTFKQRLFDFFVYIYEICIKKILCFLVLFGFTVCP